jgi:hypothetical protein
VEPSESESELAAESADTADEPYGGPTEESNSAEALLSTYAADTKTDDLSKAQTPLKTASGGRGSTFVTGALKSDANSNTTAKVSFNRPHPISTCEPDHQEEHQNFTGKPYAATPRRLYGGGDPIDKRSGTGENGSNTASDKEINARQRLQAVQSGKQPAPKATTPRGEATSASSFYYDQSAQRAGKSATMLGENFRGLRKTNERKHLHQTFERASGTVGKGMLLTEYSDYGTGDFRSPSFMVVDNFNGSNISPLRYKRHAIYRGKLPMPDSMPAIRCSSDREASTLVVTMADLNTGLEVDLVYGTTEKLILMFFFFFSSS